MKNASLYRSAVLVSSLTLLLSGCRSNTASAAPIVDGSAAATDPANVNLMPTQVAGVSYAAMPQSSGTAYPQQTTNGRATQNESLQYNTQAPAYQGDQQQQQPVDNTQQPYAGQQQPYAAQQPYTDQQAADAAEYDEYNDLLDPDVPAAADAPPPLPENYEQPEAPGPDYLWTPGYWDNASAGYYYVPGAWVAPPYVGALWTPGWWGYYGNRYRWHHGYWGQHIGYYGGINYGFGYIGFGYQGGYWNNNHFWYNTAVNRVRPGIVNNYVYNRRVEVINRTYINNSRVSYYGGQGGLRRGPTPQEIAAVRQQRIPPMQSQRENRQAAMQNRAQFFQQNHGRPNMITASRPLPAQRGIVAPPRTMAPTPGNNMRPGQGPGFNGNPQQRQQFEQQRQQFGNQQQQLQNQQRNMNEQQRQQFEQQRNMNEQQRQQFEQQGQQRQVQEQQRQQQQNMQNQQRVQQEQQRQQFQNQQQNQQRQQQEQQRQQQMNVQNQQRQQQEQQRQVQQQQQQQRQVQEQQQRVQQEQQRQQVQQRMQVEQQQRQVQEQQRQQVQQQQRMQQEQQRQVQQQQRQVQQQQRQMQQMQQHAAPQMHAAPAAPHFGGGGGEHHH